MFVLFQTKNKVFICNMSKSWLTKILPIAAIFSFRMLGLFMLIPIFSVFASKLTYATASNIGLALGAYGLTQCIFQIPFGMLSDRYGRKPILLLGLSALFIGSLIGAFASTIYGIIFARILQGAGAIGSVLIAMVIDVTAPEHRSRAMAVIGAIIGTSFFIAMILGPIIAYSYNLEGIFILTAFLALLGAMMVSSKRIIPVATNATKVRYIKSITAALKDSNLQKINFGIMAQHFMLTSSFFVFPITLQKLYGSSFLTKSANFFLPLIIISFLLTMPTLKVFERKDKGQNLINMAIFLIACCMLIIVPLQQSKAFVILLLSLYFFAFNILEASLPAQVGKYAEPTKKGTAMGIYSTFQFFGIFAGGSIAGILYKYFGASAIFIANAILSTMWIWINTGKKDPQYIHKTAISLK